LTRKRMCRQASTSPEAQEPAAIWPLLAQDPDHLRQAPQGLHRARILVREVALDPVGDHPVPSGEKKRDRVETQSVSPVDHAASM